ncbi:MAG: hypothetical protein ACRESQ_03675 [Gammaproteobacteria bacterium]
MLFSTAQFDNFANVRHYTSPGWSGNKLVWTWSNASPGACVDRCVCERRGDSEYQVSHFGAKDDGPWTKRGHLDLSAAVISACLVGAEKFHI